MKILILLSSLSFLLLSNSDCKKRKANGNPIGNELTVSNETYKGRLEIAGICKNYTISLLEGKIDTSRIESSWKNDADQKTYLNVFRLGNPCTLPDTIKQGNEFYFTIDTSKQNDCIVCMAYYPTPVKSLNIKVVKK
ncbi:MAG TPA: hypothetical protein VFV31_02035 [Chitinophagaceae bacterium]|nr:hypothetical protein [Chitinophagaceae bacterium]